MAHIKFVGVKVRVPGHPLLRMGLGFVMVAGGIFGFLPVLGYWMIPFGLMVLSVDFPSVRRWRRNQTIRLGLWLQHKYPNFARRIGFIRLRHSRRAKMQPAE
jgi:hypothetical protein